MKYGVIVSILFATIAAGGILYTPTRSASQKVSEFRETESLWEERFHTEGARAAYAQFVAEGNAMTRGQAHMTAHIVGAILYDVEALNGLSYCTHDFSYGCYHGLAGRAIETHGITEIQSMLNVCGESERLECEHGIGHGILAYFGDDRLNDALTVCPVHEGKYAGCKNGVFMEYLLGSLREGDGHPLHPLDPAAPDGPCVGVPEQFRFACYHQLPTWWRAWGMDQGDDFQTQFRTVAHYCASVDEPAMQEACISGAAGQMVPLALSDPARVQDWCSFMPANSRSLCEREATRGVEALHRLDSQDPLP